MINRILERLEELKNYNCGGMECKDCPYTDLCYEGEEKEKVVIDQCKKIVQEVANEHRKLNRCDTCTHYTSEEIVPPICYFCCKGMEDNYKAREEEA